MSGICTLRKLGLCSNFFNLTRNMMMSSFTAAASKIIFSEKTLGVQLQQTTKELRTVFLATVVLLK